VAEKSNEAMVTTEGRELVVTRVFDAPRKMVWEAWTDPKQLVVWFGPTGFTTTIEVMDVRVGGLWRQVMHGPDGTDYLNESVFTEVTPYERLVLNLSGGKEGAPTIQMERIVTFDEEAVGTRVTIRMVYPSAEAREKNVREYHAVEGGKQTMERLAEHLSARLMASTAGSRPESTPGSTQGGMR
jgi:uncharacterized protein YndB with AHSA1/START domain